MSLDFGRKTRDEVYLLDKTVSFTNHGSYGAVPKVIEEKRHSLQLMTENAPDPWFRLISPKLWDENRQALAGYLKVSDQNLLLTENATDALNAVLKSVTETFACGEDAVLEQEYTYGAIANAVDYVSKYRFKPEEKLQVFKVPCKYPISSVQEVLDEYDRICQQIIEEKKLKLRLVVLDHISSATATLFPIEKIVQVLKKWENVQNIKIKVLVDAAHAIGQVDIDLNCGLFDYYVSNLHKWFLSPRGCAFLYFKDPNETYQLLPNIISHGYGKDATKNFFERGTRDSTSWYLVRECIGIYENQFGGRANIQAYTSRLLDDAVEMLIKSWGTSRLGLPQEMEAPYMKVIKLPFMKNYHFEDDPDFRKGITSLLMDLYVKCKVIGCIVPIQGELYCRISAFVYNDANDYAALRDGILKLNE